MKISFSAIKALAKQHLGESGECVIIGGNDVLCEKRGNTFRTFRGVRVKAGDVVIHNGTSFLVTKTMEDQHFITFETRQRQ